MKQYFILTLFPEMVEQTLSHSIMGRAQKDGLISIKAVNIRDYTLNKQKHVGVRTRRRQARGWFI